MFLKRIINKIAGRDDYLQQLIKKGLKIGQTSMKTIHTKQIDGLFPWLIEIGEHVIVSTDVCIVAHDASTAPFLGYSKLGKVVIGNNVYIGQNVTILCGVTIGDNVIVGAKSLVNKNLESNFVYAGVPAKKICPLQDFLDKHKELRNNNPFFEQNFLYWQNASIAERNEMYDKLSNYGIGYLKSRNVDE